MQFNNWKFVETLILDEKDLYPFKSYCVATENEFVLLRFPNKIRNTN